MRLVYNQAKTVDASQGIVNKALRGWFCARANVTANNNAGTVCEKSLVKKEAKLTISRSF